MTLSVGDRLAKAFTPDAPTPKSIKGAKSGELNIQLIEGEQQHLFEVERIDYIYPTGWLVKLKEIE
jgi:hypothetical protein